jgi:hypothetical protein
VSVPAVGGAVSPPPATKALVGGAATLVAISVLFVFKLPPVAHEPAAVTFGY